MRKVVLQVLETLEILYPDASAELNYKNPFELLIAVILSAQCTDIRVNQVTKILFDVAPTAEALSQLPLEAVEAIIKPCGLYKTKAKNIVQTASLLCKLHEGNVPSAHDALTQLPGVGQKTANVVVSNAFGIPAIAVDTHVFRVANRIGLAKAKNVEQTEEQLKKAIPIDRWTRAHHQLIFHGRRVCKARSPMCEVCTIKPFCEDYKKRSK